MVVDGEWYVVPSAGLPQRRFGPLGACMYCGSTDVLEDEHIIPDGIGGELILTASSCRPCAKKINVWESRVQKRNMGIMRDAMGLKSRKRRGKKGRGAPLYTAHEGKWTPEAGNEGPPITDPALLPHFLVAEATTDRAALLGGKPLPGGIRGVVVLQDTAKTNSAEFEFIGGDYLRLIAKVAHGMACARLGVSAFTPCLTDLILNPGRVHFDPYVGTAPGPKAPFLHRVRLRRQIAFIRSAVALGAVPTPVITADVQLFASYGAPMYEVVVGLERYVPQAPVQQ